MKQYIKALPIAMLALGATACMDLEPKSDLSDSIVWSTADNFQLFANQFYSYERDWSSAIGDNFHSDYRGDLFCQSSINVYSAGTNAIPSSDSDYTNYYKYIYYTNLLLQNAEDYSAQSDIVVPVAEAKFFRAYYYFELVQKFGDVILITEPIDTDSEQLYGARNDRGEVIDQIISDLYDAAEGLPESPTAEGRLCKYAAYAYISRVALYEGTWQKFHTNGSSTTSNTSRSSELLEIAKSAALEVMESGKYQLFYNATLGTDSYRYMFTLEDEAQCNPAAVSKSANTEYIFANRHRAGDKIAYNITHGHLANACYVTHKIAAMYLCTDGLPIEVSTLYQGDATATAEFQNRDNRMDMNMLYNGEKYWDNDGKWRTYWTDDDLENCYTASVAKNTGYQNQKWCTERNVADYYESYDFPLIRYAEVLMNYAEACYELNGAISDTELDASLNLVRARSNPNMTKLSNSLVTTNGLSMRDEIRRERTVEFVLEGLRLDDLKRWATAATEMPQDLLGVHYTGTWFEANMTTNYSVNSDGYLIIYDSRVWQSKHYLYPMPSDQLQLNPQLTQNPGWE